jgi:hypothetical protein
MRARVPGTGQTVDFVPPRSAGGRRSSSTTIVALDQVFGPGGHELPGPKPTLRFSNVLCAGRT